MHKLNLGCGFNKLEGFINVDRAKECDPDLVFDIENPSWPWQDDSVSEVVFNHALEHIGQETKVFLRVIQELYRVCQDQAIVRIRVPHPRHDNFIDDPTHVRIITPALMTLFDREQNLQWIENKFSNSPLAIYLGVDFVIQEATAVLTQHYLQMLHDGKITNAELMALVVERNNIAEEFQITMMARKPRATADGQ